MLKKKCPRCENKLERKYSFCPYCGFNFSPENAEDYGFLGRNDFEENFDSFFGSSNNFSMNKIFQTAMKMAESMEKQMREQKNFEPPKMNPAANMDIQFYVNGKRVFPEKKEKIKPEKIIKKEISNEKAERFAKLPRKEPSTKMKRVGEKLVYELDIPGVNNIEDVLVNQLENSIEVKALSKDKVYSKIININLPVTRYSLQKGNLILELQAK